MRPSENNLTVDTGINFFIIPTIHVIIYYLHLFLAFVPVAPVPVVTLHLFGYFSF